ncbi:MAG TPA: SDR family oxidoreductase [Thermoleophilia bacterium]|nr:SDR family oxidoreductase [Thermoleophilia bacterium]
MSEQLAVVTGAASGIGRATALALANHGARVVVADLDRVGSGETAAAIEAAGGTAVCVPVDITDDVAVERLAAETGGAATILVNAAGWDRAGPFLDNDLAFIERVVQINLLGCIKLTRALLPAMIEAGGGRIINVASDAGRVGSSGETVYASAKGGVIAFTKSVAREMARHAINVNCVCPGPTDTPLFRTLPEKLQDGLVRAIPFRRLAQPDEIADAIVFFAGPSSRYITGQILSVSGGLTMAG